MDRFSIYFPMIFCLTLLLPTVPSALPLPPPRTPMSCWEFYTTGSRRLLIYISIILYALTLRIRSEYTLSINCPMLDQVVGPTILDDIGLI